jgi:hypothetical protein
VRLPRTTPKKRRVYATVNSCGTDVRHRVSLYAFCCAISVFWVSFKTVCKAQYLKGLDGRTWDYLDIFRPLMSNASSPEL